MYNNLLFAGLEFFIYSEQDWKNVVRVPGDVKMALQIH